MKTKTIDGLTLVQTPATFTDKETGRIVNYMQYTIIINGYEVLVKPVNAVAKVRLSDAFECAD